MSERMLREPAERWVAPDVGDGKRSGSASPMTVDRLEALQQTAYEEAYAQGYEAGRAEGRASLAALAAALNRCLEGLAEPFKELDEAVEQALVSLAIRVARQIIRREIKTDPGQIVGVVREAIELLPVAARNIEVHLHPDDAAVVRTAFGETGTNLIRALVEDPVMTRGGLRVVTDTSQVDARIEKRLEAVLATLVGGEREADG
ncbi:MAG: flagellar assembly protein FliH [Pseudomonadales bacterium]